ncbi:MAG TPA: M20/M25/M40 family metallo-hydrolase [Pyrinomonadaceae bacterium]|nr:M20/M25/M40 family metallo-hydrolase [Pyrinomonadaceae bacterium]
MNKLALSSVLLFAIFLALQTSSVNAQIVLERNVRAGMQFLAGDAMQGRGSGTPFERIAAEYVGSQFMQFGLEPAGEKGPDGKLTFVQSIPTKSRRTGAEGTTWNAMGKITGSDPKLSGEVILISAHLDHLGVRDNTPGDDKIFNGADDDASGTVAVIELARALANGKRPKRTIYFVAFGSEEAGGFGSRWFVENMPVAKEKLVANLQFEMIGRPDSKVRPEELWLTGFERSNLGPELAKRGAKLVQDPHPDQRFFMRSDNYQLAKVGVIAHTVSSFGLHTDYHKSSDEIKTIDFVHMTRSIDSMVKPIVWLVNSNFRPVWNEGMKP